MTGWPVDIELETTGSSLPLLDINLAHKFNQRFNYLSTLIMWLKGQKKMWDQYVRNSLVERRALTQKQPIKYPSLLLPLTCLACIEFEYGCIKFCFIILLVAQAPVKHIHYTLHIHYIETEQSPKVKHTCSLIQHDNRTYHPFFCME